MMTSGLGDMARYFTASRQNADIRTRLDRLSTELSSGRKADPATSLGAEAGRVPGIDRRIAIGTAQVSVAEQLGQRLSVMQIGLETVSRTRGQLFDDLRCWARPLATHGTRMPPGWPRWRWTTSPGR